MLQEQFMAHGFGVYSLLEVWKKRSAGAGRVTEVHFTIE
jgi:hypothetical protein